MSKEQRDVLIFHIAFTILVAIGLVIPFVSLGIRILTLVIIYNIALPVLAQLSDYPQVKNLWIFLLPLSILMIFSDWFLAEKLNIIVFPKTGSPFIGPIPIFMAGMWMIPLFLILYIGDQVKKSRGKTQALITVAVLALIVFVSSEATLWALPIWYAQNVTQIAHVALYVIVPEIILGLSAYLAYQMAERTIWPIRLLYAFTIMLIYLGSLNLFYLIIE
jgi:hypothetical protein